MPKSKNRKNHKQKVIARNRRLKEREAQLRNQLIKALERQQAEAEQGLLPPEIEGVSAEEAIQQQLEQQINEIDGDDNSSKN